MSNFPMNRKKKLEYMSERKKFPKTLNLLVKKTLKKFVKKTKTDQPSKIQSQKVKINKNHL
jgi:hypothetical protein